MSRRLHRVVLATLVASTPACRWDDVPPDASTTTDPGTSTSFGTDGTGTGEAADLPDETEPGDPWDPVPDPTPLPAADVAALGERLDAILDAEPVVGYLQTVRVLDHETGQILYERDPDQLQRPASNTKLFSTAAAMTVLGREHRVGMRVLATAEPDAAGVIAGDLYLLGLHDFSPHEEFFADPTYPFTALATRLAEAGVSSIGGASVVQGEILVEGATTAPYDPAPHLDAAAQRWDAALAGAGIAAPSTIPLSGFELPAGATELAAHDAPPLDVTVVPLNGLSHNGFAEILARHLAHEQTGQSTSAAVGAELSSFIQSIGIDDPGVVLGDGAGFASENRLSAAAVVHLLGYMLDGPLADPWVETLSVAGVRGTIGERLTGPDTLGRVHAKTGTLFDTSALSGVVFNRHDHRRYLFSYMHWNQNSALDIGACRAAQDALVTELAGSLRAPGPVPPVFTEVVAEQPGIARLTWTPAPEAEAYVVWISSDGWTWSRDDARLVHDTQFVAAELPAGGPVYFRISAHSSAGGIGRPSDVLVAVSGEPTGRRVLLVDANDHWENTPNDDNPRGFAHTFLVRYAEALPSGLTVDSAANERVRDGAIELGSRDVAVWILGEEQATHETFSAAEQDRLRDYLDSGGALLASGSEVGRDLVELGTPEDRAFFGDVFHAEYVGDAAGTFLVEPGPGGAALPRMGFLTPGQLVADSADRLAPGGDAEAWLDYVGGPGGSAAILFDGGHRAMLVGIPLETIDTREDRALVLEAALERLLP